MTEVIATPDVAVIGGGVVGLCCAYAIARKGATVMLVDAGQIGAGVSRGNVGWITPTLSSPLASPGVFADTAVGMLRLRDAYPVTCTLSLSTLRWLRAFRRCATATRFREGLRVLVALAERAAIELSNYRSQGVVFEMHDSGLLVTSVKPDGLEWMTRLSHELAQVGYSGVLEPLTGDEARVREPMLAASIKGAVYAASDRHLRPESLCDGLADHLRGRRVQLLTEAPVRSIEPGRDRIVLSTRRGVIRARDVVLAAGGGTNRLLRPFGRRLPILGAKGYSITVTRSKPKLRSALYLADVKMGVSAYDGALRVGGFFELGARSAAVAPRRIRQLMAVPGRYLRDWHMPFDSPVVQTWAGARPTTPDSLPFIGAVPGVRNLYLAAGHGMLGVTLAPATGTLIAALVLDGASADELEPFAIGRDS